MAQDAGFAQYLCLSLIWNFPSLWSVYVSFLGCYGWSKVNPASWAPPLTIIFIDADVRAIGSAFRSSHGQDRYLKRADATIPASPETIRVLTLTPSYYYSGRTTGKSQLTWHFDQLRAPSLSIFISFRLFCSFPPLLYSPYCGDSGWMMLCHCLWRHFSEHINVITRPLKVV